jgi:hypothetical protein
MREASRDFMEVQMMDSMPQAGLKELPSME